MKKELLILWFAALFALGCTNPVDHISVEVNGNFIHYKTTIVLVDPTGAALPAFTVQITGTDSASIYDYSGLKAIKATNGIVTVGVHPDFEPTATKNVTFNVVVSASNYATRIIPVTIAAGQYNQQLNVSVLKITATSVNAAVRTRSTVLASGTLGKADTLSTLLSTSITERTTVILPAGLQFKGGTGALINSTPLAETLIHYNAKSAELLGLFPGAAYSSNNVTGSDGSLGSAFFIPAAFASLDLTVGAQIVTAGSQNFQLQQQVNPDYVLSSSGQKVKAGDQLMVYSYTYTTGRWKYVTAAPVAADRSGKLSVSYNALSPGGYFVGEVLPVAGCKATTFKLLAPWLGTSVQPVNIEIWNAGGTMKLAVKLVQATDGISVALADLPATTMTYKVITANTAEVLAQGSLANPCLGEVINATLASPAGTLDNVVLKLIVNCPGKGTIIPPDFDLFYKLSSSSGAYQLLGTVKEGSLTTTLLKVGQTYDFRVNWGNETTTIKSRTISSNDTASGGGTGQTITVQACGVN